MEEIKHIFPKYLHADIENFNNEDDFMEAFVELYKQSIELIYIVVGLKYYDKDNIPKKINRDEAIIGGNLTRLLKLNTSFLQNICEGKLEICYIINRCIAETAINVKFILIEGEGNVKRNYIKHSLITEKELWETILTNIKGRNGDIFPIEERMKNSIQNSFDKSDFDVDEVKRSSKWKSIKERAALVAGDMFYSVFYGISSHAIHGNWQDIFFNNLNVIEDGFELNLEWNRPRPQIMDSPIVWNLDIVKIFCEKELFSYSKSIVEKCELLYNYRLDLSLYHEKWIEKQNNEL